MRKGMCMKSNDQPKETIHKQTHRNVISSFTGKYAFLSNFYPAPVTYMGQTYANNEAAFQAQKTCCAKEQQQFSIFRLHNPAEAKKRGKNLTLRPDWDKVKISLMYEICMCKNQLPRCKHSSTVLGSYVAAHSTCLSLLLPQARKRGMKVCLSLFYI